MGLNRNDAAVIHRAFVPGARVVHADETPIALLDPGGGKTKKDYMGACARGAVLAGRPPVSMVDRGSSAVRHARTWSRTRHAVSASPRRWPICATRPPPAIGAPLQAQAGER